MRESASSSPLRVARRAARSTWRSSIEIGASGASSLRGGPRAAQHGADAGDDLGAAERLDHVVVGAELEADDAVGLRAAGGEHDDRHAGAGADRAADVAAVAVGQVEVEQDQVGVEALGQLERAGGGAGDVRLEALAGERLGERLRDRALVLDEQDAGPLGDRHAPQCRRGSRGLCPGLTLRWRPLGGPESILLAMKPSRHQIAAGVTVVALGALATVALASGSTPATDTAAATASRRREVRTEIVRETVHRRAKARRASRGVRAASSSAERRPLHGGRRAPSPARTTSAAAAATTSASTTTAAPRRRRRRRRPTAATTTVDDHGGDDDGDGGHGGGHGRGGDDD